MVNDHIFAKLADMKRRFQPLDSGVLEQRCIHQLQNSCTRGLELQIPGSRASEIASHYQLEHNMSLL